MAGIDSNGWLSKDMKTKEEIMEIAFNNHVNGRSIGEFNTQQVFLAMQEAMQSYAEQFMPKWIDDVLRQSEPWSLLEIMKKLAEASDILLHQKDYDRLGWEEHEKAYREALKLIKVLEQIRPLPQKP